MLMAGLHLSCNATPLALEPASLLLAVIVNGQEQSDGSEVLQWSDGQLAVSERDLQAWRLLPPNEGVLVHGERYFRLGDIRGARAVINKASQTLALDAPASAFTSSSMRDEGEASRNVISAQALGGFLNHDVQWQAGTPGVIAALEMGVFNAWGSGTTTALLNTTTPTSQLIRLDTTWTIDRPDKMRALRIGDAVSLGTVCALWRSPMDHRLPAAAEFCELFAAVRQRRGHLAIDH
ncbi:MAG: hypothetical protein H7225_09500 [Massilia sp.]|nr:hypothetical protein [Aquabacterium sp.]